MINNNIQHQKIFIQIIKRNHILNSSIHLSKVLNNQLTFLKM